MCYPRHETSLSSEKSFPLQSHATGTFLVGKKVTDRPSGHEFPGQCGNLNFNLSHPILVYSCNELILAVKRGYDELLIFRETLKT
jgi:hypothetical protein